ncbi:hypothetical protein LO763_19625 [Glycomyces sp. A-F 0318]|uniref:hypothetical protein n=1 Tax=Glycomyces amatae TaxID=2881355 RepID=UPI001E419F6D|nr:hypothetical protein [Glycomyces amatae]MCD0445822.1 hypothetical protein [Glycomyces amatae]
MTASLNDRARRRAIRITTARDGVAYSEAARTLAVPSPAHRSRFDPHSDALTRALGDLYRELVALPSNGFAYVEDALVHIACSSALARARGSLQIAVAHVAAGLMTGSIAEEIRTVARSLAFAAAYVAESAPVYAVLTHMAGTAHARAREAAAIERGRCLLGGESDTTCAGAARVRVHVCGPGDADPTISDWGCLTHAAAPVVTWSDQATDVVIVDRDPAAVAGRSAVQRQE